MINICECWGITNDSVHISNTVCIGSYWAQLILRIEEDHREKKLGDGDFLA